MKHLRKQLTTTLFGLLLATGAMAQPLNEFPRTPDGKPDFSGIWQAMTKAHYDIEPHAAAYGPHPDVMGALSAIPGSQGIVEGGRIPYTEQALRQRNDNRIDAIDKDPLTKCYMPRKLPAVSFPDRAIQ